MMRYYYPIEENEVIQRNEILAEGECIVAYETDHWTGKILGSVRLVRRVHTYGHKERWDVEYIIGDGNHIHHTTTPEAISIA